ncbi:MAG: Uma2 family endonuclease [Dehalococcoidia bacterium]|nr:Uma2 family endonuclease [Dehalococcoidia bacterium]
MVAEPQSLALPRTPPLQSGDRMTRAEFERRYEGDPRKCELVEGIVYVASPVSLNHGTPHARMVAWLAVYADLHRDVVEVADNTTFRLDGDNEPQPDIALRRITGSSVVGIDGIPSGPPELVVEIAASSVSYDLHVKKNVYRRSGVQEYIAWRVFDEVIDWFRLRDGVYEELRPDAEGVIASEVFPGLRLDVAAMLRGDLRAVLARITG